MTPLEGGKGKFVEFQNADRGPGPLYYSHLAGESCPVSVHPFYS